MNRRLIVPFLSVFVYLFIYALIALLKPPTVDSIQQLQLATALPLEQLIRTPHFRSIPFNSSQIQTEKTGLDEELKTQISQQAVKQKSMSQNLGTSEPFQWEAINIESGQTLIHMSQNDNQHLKRLQTSGNHVVCKFDSDDWKNESLGFCPSSKKDRNSKKNQSQYSFSQGLATHIHVQSSKENIKALSMSQWSNVFFLYAINAQALKQVLSANMTVKSISPAEDIQVTAQLGAIKKGLQLGDYSSYTKLLKYIENKTQAETHILRFVNFISSKASSECQIMIKDQTEGILSSLNVLYGIEEKITTDELASMIRLFQSLGSSLSYFYSMEQDVKKLTHMQSWLDQAEFYYFLVGAAVVFVYLLCQVNINKKVTKQFKHVFPPGKGIKIQ